MMAFSGTCPAAASSLYSCSRVLPSTPPPCAIVGRRIRIGMPIRENDDLSNKCREAVLESLAGSTAMPFIDTSALEVIERLPGWYGRYFHSPSMTFAHYDFKRGSSIHEHL